MSLVGRAVGFAPLWALGCNHEVYSPPARMAPFETVATLARGEVGAQLEGGVHGQVFGPNAESAALRMRVGIGSRSEVSTETSVLHVDGTSVAHTFPYAFATRVGIKYEIEPKIFSLTAGAGAGASAAGGGFVSPDVGLILAFENRYLVPFLSARTSLSIPFAGRKVDTGGASDQVGQFLYEPPLTWIAGASAGLRLPLFGDCPERPRPIRMSVLGGIALTYLAYDAKSAGLWTLGGGAEAVF
jgi:hypothetical protein